MAPRYAEGGPDGTRSSGHSDKKGRVREDTWGRFNSSHAAGLSPLYRLFGSVTPEPVVGSIVRLGYPLKPEKSTAEFAENSKARSLRVAVGSGVRRQHGATRVSTSMPRPLHIPERNFSDVFRPAVGPGQAPATPPARWSDSASYASGPMVGLRKLRLQDRRDALPTRRTNRRSGRAPADRFPSSSPPVAWPAAPRSGRRWPRTDDPRPTRSR